MTDEERIIFGNFVNNDIFFTRSEKDYVLLSDFHEFFCKKTNLKFSKEFLEVNFKYWNKDIKSSYFKLVHIKGVPTKIITNIILKKEEKIMMDKQ